MTSRHAVRDVTSGVVAVVLLIVAAAVAVDAALATVVALIAVSCFAVALPLVVIRYEQHQPPVRRPHV
jgi:hypothetical protein